jgi:2-dehydropantoate 2-reductase
LPKELTFDWQTRVKILVFGAGVIGSLYAAKLAQRGHCVTVLARGQRLADIRQYGLVLDDILRASRSTTAVATIERIDPQGQYDVALITVRRDQLATAMPELATNRQIPTLLFMLNNPTGSDGLVKALGADRVFLGFPGAGGARNGHVVSYAMIPEQSTMLGELGGRRTMRLRGVVQGFREAGFPTQISTDMDVWLKTHAFFVTAVCGAIYLAGGDCRALSENRDDLRLMVEGVREGFSTVRALGFSVAPVSLDVLFSWLPKSFAIRYWRRFFKSEMGDHVFGRHARNAPREMRDIANDCRGLLRKSGVDTPALLQLYQAIDQYSE